MAKADFRAVILAGGSGERFWPLSTPERPKQFLRVFGGESLIRQAVTRLGGLVAPEDVFVVTAKNLVAATRKELPEVPKDNVVGEPMRRDTGAAVALGVGLAGGDADPVVGFFSSDQMVANPKAFRKAVAKAVAIARRKAAIVTIGIKPGYPATCFGYISPKTRAFVEKPDEKKARSYVKAGYLWNAGMFIARASTFRGAFAAHAPELECLAKIGMAQSSKRAALLLGHPLSGQPSAGGYRRSAPADASHKPRTTPNLSRIYQPLPKISFDYAVMEKTKNVEVVPGDFGWDDVGSFAAFDRYFPHDSRGNVREGPCTVVEADGNICVARSARISLLGVKNLVVVTTPDAVLVADKSRISEMKKLFKP